MTPEELRADIPATREVTYLNTGASGPSPRRVVNAVESFQEYHEYDAPAAEGMYDAARDAIDGARETVSAFIGARPEEVTFTESTTESIAHVAWALDWAPGDVVVRTDVEHPAGVLPWNRLGDTRGIDVTVVSGRAGRFDPDDFADAVADARLVCLSSVAWNYGTRLPVGEVVELAHDAGALVLVDAVQSLGQHPVDVREWGADFVAASGHKWPLGPWGSGLLYVSADAFDRLSPSRIGGWGVEDAHAASPAYKRAAAMFDVSTRSAAVVRGFEAAVRTLTDVGMDAVEARIRSLAARLVDGLPAARLASPADPETGLVTVRADDPEAVVEDLADRGIVVRSLPDPEAVRASVHAFNTEADIDALLEAL